MIFIDGKLKNINSIRSVQASTTPMDELTEEDKILKGFIWKPKDRPKSKEEIIPQLAKKNDVKPKTPVKTVPAKIIPSKTTPAKKVTPKAQVRSLGTEI
jgi:hypothetical protein